MATIEEATAFNRDGTALPSGISRGGLATYDNGVDGSVVVRVVALKGTTMASVCSPRGRRRGWDGKPAGETGPVLLEHLTAIGD